MDLKLNDTDLSKIILVVTDSLNLNPSETEKNSDEEEVLTIKEVNDEEGTPVDDERAEKTEWEGVSEDSVSPLKPESRALTLDTPFSEDEAMEKNDVYAEVNKILNKEAVGSVESVVSQALQYFEQAQKNPGYMDRVWKWIGGLKNKLGPDFNTFLTQLKQKGSSILQSLGVLDELESIGSMSGGATTYAEIAKILKKQALSGDYSKIAEALSPMQEKETIGDIDSTGTQVIERSTGEEPEVDEEEIKVIIQEFTEDVKKDLNSN